MKRGLSDASSEASYITAEDDIAPAPNRGPSTLVRGVSPPPINRGVARKTCIQHPTQSDVDTTQPTTAQVEAGAKDVTDHVEFFSTKLTGFSLPSSPSPRLPHSAWLDLYHRNQSPFGNHFVIHQHDHPVAGTHYDLRLQINSTSSISFAIMYGLPGDPNSRRLNRNATETRVHCLWNHLIETASPETGTMLIWDTGEYEILEKASTEQQSQTDTDSDPENASSFQSSISSLSESEKLAAAFSHRKIRLRLHGTRLPKGYTIYLRLTKVNDRSTQPKAPAFKRQRKSLATVPAARSRRDSTTSNSSASTSSPSPRSPSPDVQQSESTENTQATRDSTHRRLRPTVSSLKRIASPPRRHDSEKPTQRDHQPQESHSKPTSSIAQSNDVDNRASSHSRGPSDVHAHLHTPGDEFVSTSAAQAEQDQIRQHNAYPGAHNSVNSIHQRKWYLSLDRTLSGFFAIPTPRGISHHAKTYWVPVTIPDSKSGVDDRARQPQQEGKGHEQQDRNFLPQQQQPQQEQAARLKRSRNAPGFTRFHVLGRDHERSVVTGRLAAQILADEGVEGYMPRGRWRAVVE